ncbi:MAG: NAD-dependent epimerase, partial [Gemmatimonadetes bacterium]
MTVLVTGGNGLVGSHVISALKSAGETVRALVHPRSRDAVVALGAEPIEGDTRDPDAWRVAAAGARAIVHAAAIVAAKASHEEFFAVNVGGTGQAITAAREAGARLVHVSSVAVYGRTRALAAGAGVDENSPFGELQPHDFYAQSKRRAEEVLWEEVARGG